MSSIAAPGPAVAQDHCAPTSRAVEQQKAVRHTKRVKRLRLLLPMVSGLIALGLIGMALLPKFFPLAALAGLSLTADGLVMNSPRLAGHLGEGRRYEVVAARAVQSLLHPSRLSLEGLSAEFDMGKGDRVTMEGNRAAYDTSTEVLTLDGGVSIDSTDGNKITLPSATVRLREGSVESEGNIAISSPKGEIHAGAISVAGGGDLIRLTGGVSITIHPSRE